MSRSWWCCSGIRVRPGSGEGPGAAESAGLRGHIRRAGWGPSCAPAALMGAAMPATSALRCRVAVAGVLVLFAPWLAARSSRTPFSPWPLRAHLAKDYHDGFNNQVLYGCYWATAACFPGGRRFVLPLGGLFLVLGLWLLLASVRPEPGSQALIGRWRDPRRGGITPAHGFC